VGLSADHSAEGAYGSDNNELEHLIYLFIKSAVS
jgi:hypothetical protein